jgi:hypothetical protein
MLANIGRSFQLQHKNVRENVRRSLTSENIFNSNIWFRIFVQRPVSLTPWCIHAEFSELRAKNTNKHGDHTRFWWDSCAVPFQATVACCETSLSNCKSCTICWLFTEHSYIIANSVTLLWKMYYGIGDITKIPYTAVPSPTRICLLYRTHTDSEVPVHSNTEHTVNLNVDLCTLWTYEK